MMLRFLTFLIISGHFKGAKQNVLTFLSLFVIFQKTYENDVISKKNVSMNVHAALVIRWDYVLGKFLEHRNQEHCHGLKVVN